MLWIKLYQNETYKSLLESYIESHDSSVSAEGVEGIPTLKKLTQNYQ